MRGPPRYPTRRGSIAPVSNSGWSPWAIVIIVIMVMGFAGELSNFIAERFKAKAAEIASLP